MLFKVAVTIALCGLLVAPTGACLVEVFGDRLMPVFGAGMFLLLCALFLGVIDIFRDVWL